MTTKSTSSRDLQSKSKNTRINWVDIKEDSYKDKFMISSQSAHIHCIDDLQVSKEKSENFKELTSENEKKSV